MTDFYWMFWDFKKCPLAPRPTNNFLVLKIGHVWFSKFLPSQLVLHCLLTEFQVTVMWPYCFIPSFHFLSSFLLLLNPKPPNLCLCLVQRNVIIFYTRLCPENRIITKNTQWRVLLNEGSSFPEKVSSLHRVFANFTYY